MRESALPPSCGRKIAEKAPHWTKRMKRAALIGCAAGSASVYGPRSTENAHQRCPAQASGKSETLLTRWLGVSPMSPVQAAG